MTAAKKQQIGAGPSDVAGTLVPSSVPAEETCSVEGSPAKKLKVTVDIAALAKPTIPTTKEEMYKCDVPAFMREVIL